MSLSGGRIGPAERSPSFGRPGAPPPSWATQGGARPAPGRTVPPDCDISFIDATGEHEILSLPDTSPWAEKYGADPRRRLPDVIDVEPGRIYDTRGDSNPSWGLLPRPGTAHVYVFPNARDGRLVAEVVRLDKRHTEGLEPKITEELVKMMVAAPGGKAQELAAD